MALLAGTHELGPADGVVELRTTREGPAARLGHDLLIVAGAWSATATVDPGEPTVSSVEAAMEVASLDVVEGIGGLASLKARDIKDIRKNLSASLRADAEPTIRFRSTAVAGDASSLQIEGALTIAGATRPATLRGTVDDEGLLVVTATVRQTDHGIKPYGAMLGALRVGDDVEVRIAVRLPTAADDG